MRRLSSHESPDYRAPLRPHTAPGAWSLRLLAGSVALFVAFFLLVASGQRGGDTFFSNLWLASTILAAAGLAIGAGAIGLVAVIGSRERSSVVLTAIAVGLVVTVFLIGEVGFPH